MDETGKQFEHRPTTVVARKGVKSLPGRTGNSKENVTILACVNAQGGAIPESAFAPSLLYDKAQDRSSSSTISSSAVSNTSVLQLPLDSEMPPSLTESPTVKEPISYAVPSEAFNDSNSVLNLSLLANAAEMHPEVSAGAPEIDLPIPDVLSLLTTLGNGNFILTEEEPVQSSSWN